MTVQEMHYDFKQKLNKVDSQQNRNLRIPEIDWKLNEACELFIKTIAEPRYRITNTLGFEKNQRNIDSIRTLVVSDKGLVINKITEKTFIAKLPDDYMFYISSKVIMDKSPCPKKEGVVILRQFEDDFETNVFEESSFEWGEVNIKFVEDGILIFTDGTFSITNFKINYIRRPKYIHFAKGFLDVGEYTLPSGEKLVGIQNCELPQETHREIVDIAVLLTSGDLSLADYQLKQNKVNNLNQINQ